MKKDLRNVVSILTLVVVATTVGRYLWQSEGIVKAVKVKNTDTTNIKESIPRSRITHAS